MTQQYLAIDASTYAGSAAIVTNSGAVKAEIDVAMRGTHEERLMPAIAGLLASTAVSPDSLAAVICGAGPGSFTSLRIAASIAKGIAWGAGIPLYSVSSLLLIPASVSPRLAAGGYLAMLDAMRGDYYALRCRVPDSGVIVADEEVRLIASGVAGSERIVGESDLTQIGPGRTIDASPHARGAALLIHSILASGAVDLSSWEPDYGRLAEAEVRLGGAQKSQLPR